MHSSRWDIFVSVPHLHLRLVSPVTLLLAPPTDLPIRFSSSVQLPCAKFQRPFNSFALCPLGLQLFSPLLPFLLGQLSFTEAWWVKKGHGEIANVQVQLF